MNGSEAKYNSEYVDIKTTLEHIRTKVESIESLQKEMHQEMLKLNDDVNKNRSEIAGVKATAAVIGAAAGSIIALLTRFFLLSKS